MSEWISTKDELPENHKLIMFWSSNDCMVRIGALYAKSGKFIADGDKYYGCDVSHWQPLPEPPK